MYERLSECPVCSFTHFDNYSIVTDHSISKESFALVKCGKCGLIFTNPRPNEENISDYYKSDNYISHTNKSNNPINFLYKLSRIYTFNYKLQIINKYIKSGRVLDYGCGTGNFLSFLKNKGWDIYGVEPNSIAREQAQSKLGSAIHSTLKESKSNDLKFDLITSWHVVEHIHDLKETFRKVRKRLAKGGYFIVAVPNIDSPDQKIYKENWAAFDVPRHLYHFNKDTFHTLAKKTKFKLIETHGLPLDSYYVSLLSERYQHNKSNYIKAFKNGRISNKQARKNCNYSSLIFVLQK